MVKQRNEIDEKKYQWDLSTIFATDQAWEEEATALAAAIKDAAHFAGSLLSSPANLLETTRSLFGLEPSFGEGLCLRPYEE